MLTLISLILSLQIEKFQKEDFMKSIRKILTVICAVLMFIAMVVPTNVFANEMDENNLYYKQYEQFQEEGVLGSDVTYDDWRSMVNSSFELEKILENSTEFKEVYSSDNLLKSSRFTVQRGDVIITNGTSSAGILGHAGIATSSNYILHIAGKGYHPVEISLSRWHSKYTNKSNSSWTKVYRHSDYSVADYAAEWAEDTYLGSNAEYKITGNLASTDVTYCSKIVWQAYYYGPSSHEANGPTIGYRMPYDLPDTIHNLSYEHTY